eukprot:CAMPEP_0176496266 /NCGR_PEP_ID=MMETSP0200_2-20121128/11103_1 /TAXON_ID=947934 /ORGANISM="Chaetoceros sp., Strain GSL56" /LENGTH=203 /DNA_ID=CAMNT_0017894209 /DNA_START=415 /DNA_END=1026 /DNA_ORIENTATION=-
MDGCPKITTITCADDLFDFLKQDSGNDDKDDDRLYIIKYYASWCKSCAKFGMKFKQLAMIHGDLLEDNNNNNNNNHQGAEANLIRKGSIHFAQAEYSETRSLCRSMGINKLPFVQIYKAGGEKVDEFVCGPRDFNVKVKDRVEELLLGMSSGSSTSDGDDDRELRFQREMEEGQSLSNGLLSSMVWDKESSVGAKQSSSPKMV